MRKALHGVHLLAGLMRRPLEHLPEGVGRRPGAVRPASAGQAVLCASPSSRARWGCGAGWEAPLKFPEEEVLVATVIIGASWFLTVQERSRQLVYFSWNNFTCDNAYDAS